MVFYNSIPLAKGIYFKGRARWIGITNQYSGRIAEWFSRTNAISEWNVEVNNEVEYYYPKSGKYSHARLIQSGNKLYLYETILSRIWKKPIRMTISVLDERNMAINSRIGLDRILRELDFVPKSVLSIIPVDENSIVLLMKLHWYEDDFGSDEADDVEASEQNEVCSNDEYYWETSRVAIATVELINGGCNILGEYELEEPDNLFDCRVTRSDDVWEMEYKIGAPEYKHFPYFSEEWERKIVKMVNGEVSVSDCSGKTTYEELDEYFSKYVIEENAPSGYFKSGHYTLVNKVTGETIIDTILKPGMYALRMYVDIPRIMVINVFDNKKKTNVAYVLQVQSGEIAVDRVLDLDYYANIRFDEDNEAVIIENGNETVFITEKEL